MFQQICMEGTSVGFERDILVGLGIVVRGTNITVEISASALKCYHSVSILVDFGHNLPLAFFTLKKAGKAVPLRDDRHRRVGHGIAKVINNVHVDLHTIPEAQ